MRCRYIPVAVPLGRLAQCIDDPPVVQAVPDAAPEALLMKMDFRDILGRNP
jgi:hypothetical protein